SAVPAAAPAAPAVHPSLHACQASLAALLAHEQIEFAPGSARIDKKSAPLLDRLAQQVRGCPGTVRIEGYTDSVGRGLVNLHLSEARATAVRNALIARGAAPTRLRTRGYGRPHPPPRRDTRARGAHSRPL